MNAVAKTKEETLQDIGRGCAESIASMVAALEFDYDRFQELSEERAEWMKEQLKLGNTVTLEYTATPIERVTIQ
jgi:hypothetical protein